MALETTTNKAQYECNGSTTEFDLAVRILDEDDVKVFIKNTTTGVQTELAKTTDFAIDSISGDYDNGARVTTLTTYSSIYEITLLREVDFNQGLDLVEGGDLSSEGLENALDKGVMQAQQLDEQLGRTIVAPTTDESGITYDIGTAEERANKVLGYDASGNVTQVALTETGTVGVDTDAGLSIASNIISAKVDASTIGFDGTGNLEVKDDGIDTDQLADNAVDTAQLAESAVDTDQLADSAVTLAKLDDMATQSVIGRVTIGTDVPEVFPIVGVNGSAILINDNDFLAGSVVSGATQGSIKAYMAKAPNFTPSTYEGGESVTLPNGLVMKMGYNSGNAGTVTFAAAFGTAVISITTSPTYTNKVGSETAITASSASAFTYESDTNATGIFWTAIGH